MKISTTQLNNNIKSVFKNNADNSSYLNANTTIYTNNNIHPLPPEGHLIHDNFKNSFKYFFKDINYALKSLKEGIKGNANDHQLGQTNRIGLVGSGLLIATYLSTTKSNLKNKIMEFVGLGSFLAAIAIYPKLAINLPAKLKHGFDIDKQYIDDQGRKKSVMQDVNYIPYDLYLGDIPEENISKIGDKMGIARNIKDRDTLVKDQMRKISTQNNTLWMLTAGITPAIAALLSCGVENILSPILEKYHSIKYNFSIKHLLKATEKMNTDINSMNSTKLSRAISKKLNKYKNSILPQEEFNNILNLLSKNLLINTKEGLEKDLYKILNNYSKSIIIDDFKIQNALDNAKNTISKNNKILLEPHLIPNKNKLTEILNNYSTNLNNNKIINIDYIPKLKKELQELINTNIEGISNVPKEFLNLQKNRIIDSLIADLTKQDGLLVTEEAIIKIENFAKILDNFKKTQKKLNKFSETILNKSFVSNSYTNFQKEFLNILNIKDFELKKMAESEIYTSEILDKKINELCKNELKYKKAITKLTKIMSKMDTNINGKFESNSNLLDLIHGIENNYNNTAKRLHLLGSFDNTIERLVQEDVSSLSKSLKTKQDLLDFIDGITENRFKDIPNWESLDEQSKIKYIKNNSKGVGSSKNLEIVRILDNYQSARNTYNRIIHLLDVYKRSSETELFANALYKKESDYINNIIKTGKETLLKATCTDHTLKLNTVNNPDFYKDLMNSLFESETDEFWTTKQKGKLSKSTKEAIKPFNDSKHCNTLDRIQYYLTRFRNLIGNNDLDFTKPNHILNPYIKNHYDQNCRTRKSLYNLIGQTPVDFAKNAAKERYNNRTWLKIISGITGGVFGIAFIAQLFFGKLNNPQNLEKKRGQNDNI